MNKKYNPDIDVKYKNKELDRNEKYTLNNSIYNPITNIIPETINSSKDLILEISDTKYDFKKLLMEKEKERAELAVTYQKSDQITYTDDSSSAPSFTDLKEQSTNQNIKNNNKYNDLFNELKDLGIFNN
jgi:hypothetical protein